VLTDTNRLQNDGGTGAGRVHWTPTLDVFLILKPHWKVSVGAMIVRCGHLGILSEVQRKARMDQLEPHGCSGVNLSLRGSQTRQPSPAAQKLRTPCQ